MAVFKSYPHGVPSWVDLATRNPEGAKKFYTRLFGWDFDDFPVPDGGGAYTMYKRQGEYVAASATYSQRSGPPHWQLYFSVDDVDAATKTVGRLGGTVVDGPFDVMDAGHMSVIKDPQGAVCMLWQAKNHIGAGRQNEPGSMSWVELVTSDATGAVSFYDGVLKSTSQSMSQVPQGSNYYMLSVADEDRAGVLHVGKEWNGTPSHWAFFRDVPPHWVVYFGVDDLDAAIGVVRDAGGEVVTEPTQIPNGMFAFVKDPEGAAFGLFMK